MCQWPQLLVSLPSSHFKLRRATLDLPMAFNLRHGINRQAAWQLRPSLYEFYKEKNTTKLFYSIECMCEVLRSFSSGTLTENNRCVRLSLESDRCSGNPYYGYPEHRSPSSGPGSRTVTVLWSTRGPGVRNVTVGHRCIETLPIVSWLAK